MTERYTDQMTGEVFSSSDLEAQYRTYVAELGEELPDVQPCSFAHWLRGEFDDRLLSLPAVPERAEGRE